MIYGNIINLYYWWHRYLCYIFLLSLIIKVFNVFFFFNNPTRIQAIKCIDCLDYARTLSFDTHTPSGTWDQYRWNICQLILKKSIENSLLYHRFGSFQFPTWAEPALLDSLIYSIDWHREMKKRNDGRARETEIFVSTVILLF